MVANIDAEVKDAQSIGCKVPFSQSSTWQTRETYIGILDFEKLLRWTG